MERRTVSCHPQQAARPSLSLDSRLRVTVFQCWQQKQHNLRKSRRASAADRLSIVEMVNLSFRSRIASSNPMSAWGCGLPELPLVMLTDRSQGGRTERFCARPPRCIRHLGGVVGLVCAGAGRLHLLGILPFVFLFIFSYQASSLWPKHCFPPCPKSDMRRFRWLQNHEVPVEIMLVVGGWDRCRKARRTNSRVFFLAWFNVLTTCS